MVLCESTRQWFPAAPHCCAALCPQCQVDTGVLRVPSAEVLRVPNTEVLRMPSADVLRVPSAEVLRVHHSSGQTQHRSNPLGCCGHGLVPRARNVGIVVVPAPP